MNPSPASAPAILFEVRPRRRRRLRPRAIAVLAAAGLVAAAVPSSLLAASPSARSHPAKTVNRSVAAAGSTASATAASVVVRRATNADGTSLARRLAKDPALRRTLAALQSAKGKAGTPAASIVVGGSVADIPAVALAAYQRAASNASSANPGCNIPWTLVSAIGRVESDHGQYGGSRPAADGEVHPSILGPVLDGSGGNAAIPDTDGGRYDGDTRWDRAVGPMQFIPSTWALDGRDGNGDGIRDPENLFDAALATADYLCASGGDLTTPAAAERAVLSYNHSLDYVLVVLGYTDAYGGQDLSPVTADIAEYLASLSKAAKAKAAKAAKAQHKKPAKRVAKKVAKKPVVHKPTPAPHPSVKPTARPTPPPVTKPTTAPTHQPTPVTTPTAPPTEQPTESPTPTGTPSPTGTPTPDAAASDSQLPGDAAAIP